MLRFAVLLIVATISTAQAEQREPRTLFGPLGFSCDKWINAPEDTGERAQLRMWILGYLSGLNTESSTDFLQDRDVDGLLVWRAGERLTALFGDAFTNVFAAKRVAQLNV